MRIALLGTRGVPARYGGFETAIVQVGRRLAERGHEVVVYCRGGGTSASRYEGMTLVHLPALRHKVAETLSHTALSALHLILRHRPDAAVVFNAANAPFLPLLRAADVPVATHVDGLEWQRAKWGAVGRGYYRLAEGLAVRWSNELIADARKIQSYYSDRYAASSVFIPYGAPILRGTGADALAGFGLSPRRYHLVVARLEPENNTGLIVEGYLACPARLPLVVVGAVPYPSDYSRRVAQLAARSESVHMLGYVYDQQVLDELYANAFTYVHGHSVGGTNPSLLRAMGGGTAVLALDNGFNREVLAETGLFFRDPDTLAALVDRCEQHPDEVAGLGQAAQERVARHYNWDDVADGYERLCRELAEHAPPRSLHRVRGPRRLGLRSRGGGQV